jgi:DNA-binding GntR family transcriptional regulator
MTGPVTFDRVGRMPRLSDTIAEQLLEAIVAGRFKEGDILPSELNSVISSGCRAP